MNTTRREFIRQAGVFLATVLTSSCQPSCYVTPAPTLVSSSRPTFVPGISQMSRDMLGLRAAWLYLKDSRLATPEDTDFSSSLRRQHADILNALVANKELQADVAADIGLVFEQAIAHIQRRAGPCCYEPMPPEYTPRQYLTSQAAVLTEMAGRSNIDPDTVARAREAMARDMAWLAQFQAGQRPGELSGIDATPAEVEAARILVELLLGKK